MQYWGSVSTFISLQLIPEARKGTLSSDMSRSVSRPQSLCTRPHLYPSSAPMSPYRTPYNTSREDILEMNDAPQSLPMSPQFRSADNIIDESGQKGDGGDVVERPPKPKHRPKRRSRSDLPTDFKAILAELKETSTEGKWQQPLCVIESTCKRVWVCVL